MDLLQAAISDGALVAFSLAGLIATGIAIVRDTAAQRADLGSIPVEGGPR